MVTAISKEESQQLLRTVEMFEAITQSQPDDYQSLEILKEAYVKLGRVDDTRRISSKLAHAYAGVGQISQAILEYEGILQQFPNDAEAQAALAELESRTQQFSSKTNQGVSPDTADSKPRKLAPVVTTGAGAPPSSSVNGDPGIDGDRALAEALIAEKLLTPQSLQPLLLQLKEKRPELIKKGQCLTLGQLLAEQQLLKLDDLLVFMVNKSDCPYLPLSVYDVDRDVACLLPRDVALAQCVVPFDVIGRSALVATANPLDAQAREYVQQMLAYNIFWFVSSPAEIMAVLRNVHGFDGKRPKVLGQS